MIYSDLVSIYLYVYLFSYLSISSVPVIPTNECQREDIYGKDKLSSGMFCGGILEVYKNFVLKILLCLTQFHVRRG